MSIATHKDEIVIYCNPKTEISKKVIAFAKGVAKINEVDVIQNPPTATQMREILKTLELRPKDLLNRADDYYQKNISGKDFNTEGWLNILIRNPTLWRAPIALRGNKAVLCDNPTNVLQL